MKANFCIMALIYVLYVVFIPHTQGLPIVQVVNGADAESGSGSGDASISFTTIHAQTTTATTTTAIKASNKKTIIAAALTISFVGSLICYIYIIYHSFECCNRRKPTFSQFIIYFAQTCVISDFATDDRLIINVLFRVSLPVFLFFRIISALIYIYKIFIYPLVFEVLYPICIKPILYDFLYHMFLMPILYNFLYKKILLGAISKIKHLYYFLKEYINHRNTIVNLESDAVNKECYICGTAWGTQLEPKQIEDFDTILLQNIDALNALQEIIELFTDYNCKVIPITLVNCKCNCKTHMCFHCAITNLLLAPSETCPTCRTVYNVLNMEPCGIIIPQNDDPVLAQEIKTPSTPNNIVRVPSNETIV